MIHVMLDLETWGTEPGCDIRSIGACVFDPLTGDVGIPCQTCKGGTTRGNINDGGDCSDCMNTRMERGYGSSFYVATENPIIPRDGGGFPMCDGAAYWDATSNEYRKYFLRRDPKTVEWWSEQSAEAQAAFADPLEIGTALVHFGDWLRGLVNDHYYVVSNDEKYDNEICLWSHGAAFDPPILAAAYRKLNLPVAWHYRAPRDTRTLFDVAGIDDHSAWLKKHPGPLGIPHHALDDAICQARAVCAAYAIVREWRDDADALDSAFDNYE